MLLQSEESVLVLHLFSEEIRADGGLVLVTELLVHILVHQGSLPDPAVAEDDDLEKRAAPGGHRDLPRPRARRAGGGDWGQRREGRNLSLRSCVCCLAVVNQKGGRDEGYVWEQDGPQGWDA
jgi:hypothetical protein